MIETKDKTRRRVRTVAALICGAMFMILKEAVLSIPQDSVGLAHLVAERVPESGVTNPITAVLLSFRAYDTLLEIGVLVLAAIGVLSLISDRVGTWGPVAGLAGPVLSALARLMAPLMIVFAGYLLWVGAYAPGGAFQAGSILGAAGVLLALSGYTRPHWVSYAVLRLFLGIGFVVFLGVAFATMLTGGAMLQYPPGTAKTLILVIETWLTLSIGAIFVSLFLASAAPIAEQQSLGGVRE